VKVEILNTRNLFFWKFAAVCRKIAISCPLTFINPCTTPHVGFFQRLYSCNERVNRL